MGSASHLTPQRFAEELRAYLWDQIESQGADKSGRWLTAATDGSRSREYWRKIIAGAQAMTTNDIEILATLFEQSPYEFIRAARQWNTPNVIDVDFNVGPARKALPRVARKRDPEPDEEQ